MTRLFPAAVAAAWLLAGSPRSTVAQEAAPPETSTRSGAYTAAQARRGADAYRKHCTECHVPADVTGAPFRRAWAGRTVYDYFELIRTTMPNDNPGKLSRGQYVDIVAYLLQLSGMPPGETPLPSDSAALRRIRIEAEPVPSR
ncbi:MAG TPA: cytochrome c [Gemmatimonadales bacterium]|nr:cytochrome c [Gemmatimonadales bacterium]